MASFEFKSGLGAVLVLLSAPAAAQSSGEMAAEVAGLKAQIEQLQARVAELERTAAAPAPAPAGPAASAVAPDTEAEPAPQADILFSGAPHFTAPGGWSFKPRGRLLYDAGWVGRPDGVDDRGLGFASELRRARLGVEGTIPGGFGYKFELDFAEGTEITDVFLSYAPSEDWTLVVGQQNGFQSLEEVMSSNFASFIERAAFTDAFNFERRLGVSATYHRGAVIASGGVFTDNVADLASDENNARSVDGRLVFAPRTRDTQLHFGGSAHFRDSGDLYDAGVTNRYSQRPLVHTTDTRFIGTPELAVDRETSYGLEAALIRGRFHAASEVHWLRADIPRRAGPTFFGGYVEAGLYLTDDTRGYREGTFDRTKVSRPLGAGGFGALQLNLRYDRLDLNDDGIVGGTQDGYYVSLIWIPTDYVRFLLNYGRLNYKDAAVPAAGDDRDYGIDVIGARAQVDF